MPPEYLLPFLQSIESTIVNLRTKEFPNLKDKEVERVYDQLRAYYNDVAKGKDVEEPITTSERRQILIDELLNMIDVREELANDEAFINNPSIQPKGRPISSLAEFYAISLKYLCNSVRFWRKKDGPVGYLNYIRESGAL